MSETTDIQLGGTKKRASLTPSAKAKRARARRLGNKARAAAAAKAGRVARAALLKVRAASGRPESATSQEMPGDEGGTAAHKDGTEPGNESGLASSGEGVRVKRFHGSGNMVKAHTEAGKKRLVNRLLGLAETQATEGGFKITPADLIRLMQLHKELNPQKDRKVTVQWVEDRSE